MNHRINRRRALAGFTGALAAAAAPVSAFAQNRKVSDKYSPEKEVQRRKLYALLGDLPERGRKITAKLISRDESGPYILEKLMLDLNGIEPVPAFFVRPKNSVGRTPAVLYNHAHFGVYDMGKNEFVRGRAEIQTPPWAEELTGHGYSALCIDAWAFGERRGRSESEIFKEMLWKGRSMWGMMVYDAIRAVDYLVSRPDIDPDRIATMGMSMGSTTAWWLAALDSRIRVCVDICCLTDYQSLIEADGLDLHGIYYYVPNLLSHFTASQINALISPRPHLGLAGKYDPLTPYPGLLRIDTDLREAYRRDGAPEAWKLNIYDIAHYETAEMRADILEFLEIWL